MTQTIDRSQTILFREYGRNVQNMVAHMLATPDRDQRTRMARTIIELMRGLNPEPGNETADYYHKLWDHLFVMSGFAMDVDSPFPAPAPEKVYERPAPMDTTRARVRNKNYGRNLQAIIEKVVATEDEADREAGIIYVGRLLKGFYANYTKEVMDDASALTIIRDLSNGKLTMDLSRVEREGLFQLPRDYKPVHNFAQEGRGEPTEERQGKPKKRGNFPFKKKKRF